MPKRDWLGKAIGGTMQHIADRPNKGETIGGTTEDDMGDEETNVLPDYIDKSGFSRNELEILRQALLNYEANNKEIAEIVGFSQPVVSEAINKFIREYPEEIKSNNTRISPHYDSVLYLEDNPNATKEEVENELGISFGSNGWGVVKSTFAKRTGKAKDQTTTEEEERERVYKYFKGNPKASLEDAMDSVGPDMLDTDQLRALKANAVKHSNNDTTENMQEETEIDEETEKEAIQMLIDKVDKIDSLGKEIKNLNGKLGRNSDDIHELTNYADELNDELERLKSSIDIRRGEIQGTMGQLGDLEEEIEELNKTVEAHGNSINKLVKEVNENDEQKRYVGKQETITLELTDFEAMFIANRLWEAGEAHSEIGEERTESEAKMWARKIHGERNTRD